MSLVKELLLLLFTFMHISLMASCPVRSCEGRLALLAVTKKQYFTSLFEDLQFAKEKFVENLFPNTTSETKTKNLKLLDGITIPAGNRSFLSIVNSMCEISECLTSYLQKVIGNLTTDEDLQTIIRSYTRPFKTPLNEDMKGCCKEDKLKVCPKNLANNQTYYEMKKHALDVLHTAANWTGSLQQLSDQ